MTQELGRTPTHSEVFTRAHTKKKDRGQWVDKRAEDANQEYDDEIKRLEEQRAELISAGCPEPPPIDYDAVWLRIVGGRKKGRIYGRGKVLSRLKPLACDSDDYSTASGPVDMREELTQQVEEHSQEVAALRTQHTSNLTRLQSTIDSQSAEFDRWKNTVTQMYSFMQTMQAGTTTSIPGMPSPMPPPPPPPPLHPGSSSATEQPTPDADRPPHLDKSPHDDSDYV
ncbi:hypothetical protein PIB30_028432 [Stylosanthes scabra]|uniref:Uncharacterized protein n=1 Tax=Stylosanthes scabra TaxID=79078 RepID=A0ABU6WAX0_9FABA|nr:hypothetical protein [Stylosanthes scabra]